MIVSTWVLIIFLYVGGNYDGGAVTQIEYSRYEDCKAALANVEKLRRFREGACIERKVLK